MSWPEPRPGLVIRYSYLWSREAALGREDGVKDRPCAIVLAIAQDDGTRVYVLPITHAAPDRAIEAVELPASVKARLSLDDERSWVVLTETRLFRVYEFSAGNRLFKLRPPLEAHVRLEAETYRASFG